MHRRIGITCDTHRHGDDGTYHYDSPAAYARAVAKAGGVPVLLPCEIEHVADYVELCDGFVLTGGDDPDTRPFGEPTHPRAKVMHPMRQRFETALIAALDDTTQPVLGICWGMQLMALHAGGSLIQHLPDDVSLSAQQAELHREGDHDIVRIVDEHDVLPARGRVHSKHHQAIGDAGSMRIVALSDQQAGGAVIEAIDRPGGRLYLGVQWHPERTAHKPLGQGLFARLIASCGR